MVVCLDDAVQGGLRYRERGAGVGASRFTKRGEAKAETHAAPNAAHANDSEHECHRCRHEHDDAPDETTEVDLPASPCSVIEASRWA